MVDDFIIKDIKERILNKDYALLTEKDLQKYVTEVLQILWNLNGLLKDDKVRKNPELTTLLSEYAEKITDEIEELLKGIIEQIAESKGEGSLDVRVILIGFEEIAFALEEMVSEAPDFWLKPYINLLNTIAFTYINFRSLLTKEEKVRLQQYFERILKKTNQFSANTKIKARYILTSIINYINALHDIGETEQAISFFYKIHDYVRECAFLFHEEDLYVCFLTNLAGILCSSCIDFEKARQLLLEAEKIASKIYNTDKELFFDLYANVMMQFSLYYEKLKNKYEAINYAKRAIELYRENSIVNSFLNLKDEKEWAIVYMDEVSFLDFRNIRDTKFDVISQFIQVVLNTAYMYREFSEIEEAIKVLKSIERQVEILYKGNSFDILSLYITLHDLLGQLYLQNSQYSEAEHHFSKALQVYKSHKHSIPTFYPIKLITILINLGTIHIIKNNYERSLQFLKEAAEIINEDYFRVYNEDRNLIQYCYFNMGIVYIKLKKYNFACEAFKKSHDIAKEIYRENENDFDAMKEYTKVLNALAFATELIGDYQNSKKYYQEVVTLGEKVYHQDPDSWRDNFITDLIKYTYHLARDKELEEAIKVLEKAYNYVNPLYEEDNEYWINTYFSIVTYLAELYEHFGAVDLMEKFKSLRKELLIRHSEYDLLSDHLSLVNFSEELYRKILLSNLEQEKGDVTLSIVEL